ncbi:type VI secretion system membrane subunit TssM [Aquabacterium sp.]|uniref:type VI secretion system membrane subunit TssM n=1 Tax=Aquabacterium sp. TaxID=1872578 RepID=UPI002BBF985B|nr:type VI secretion system membrane subunit TssM [Aquabacterium sp.]HSW08444.1 type VI secretion system membrane subunit TssM [Aquabacterium sp.]
MKPLLPRLQTLANLGGAALLVWLAAPLLVVAGQHPFDSRASRAWLLLGIAATALLLAAMARLVRRRRNAQLFAQLQAGHEASQALTERFATAMRLLRSGIAVRKTGSGVATRWWQRRRQVYQLPWYLFIGAPGAGKTTALLHSGLRFPLAEQLGSAPVAGVGGTRQCDWWFTEQAVFIDTAGRFTTQDSHAGSDAQEWRLFLRLLRRYRALQPINGVIVTVSAPDLLQGSAELAHQAIAVDRRLQELRSQLGLSFPVYLLVTKVDLLAGFVEYFGEFDTAQREQPWGICFDLPSATDGKALPDDMAARLAELPARIAAMCPQHLQAEPLLQRRAAIYHFAAQVEALLPALETFAQRAFRACHTAPRQPVRGIHLSSGTQEGNPIDRVLGELSRSYGFALQPPPPAAATGKAYFLAALLQRLVIAEAPLAGLNLRRRQQRRWLAAMAGSALSVLMLLACVGWVISYRNNLGYVESVRQRVQKVARQIEPAPAGRIDQLLPLYALLNQLAASGSIDPAEAPWGLGFGLFQGPRLARSAEQTYHQVLDRSFAPLLAERLTQALQQEADPITRYDALRVALMLTTPGRLQRGEVRRWAAQAFSAAPVTGSAAGGASPGAAEQQEWLRHLDALLERNAVLGVLQLDGAAVRTARAALAGVPFEQRVHERLLRRARERLGGEPRQADLAGPAAELAFAPPDAVSGLPALPAELTRHAWRGLIDPALEPTIAELADEAQWVLGDLSPALQRLPSDRAARDAVARQVGARHARATIAQWDRWLAALALQPPADSEALARFTAGLAAAQSPLRGLLRRITSEFPAAASRSAPADPAASPAPTAVTTATGATAPTASSASAATEVLDAALAAHFGALRNYAAASGEKAIDRLVVPLAEALQDAAGRRSAESALALRAEAAVAPAPLREVWTGLADALALQQRRTLERQLGGGLAELTQACRRIIGERFPFAADAKRDLPFADFARLFGPQGLLDGFFRAHLAGRVDTQRRPWRVLDDTTTTAADKARATLRSFEMAEDIRRLFFQRGAALPQLRLQLTPAAMDAELLMFSADVDGQLLRYENGPRRAKDITWPGPAGTQRVVLRILPAGPGGVGAEVHEGPWALLRVLQRSGLQRGSGPAAVAQLQVDGRSLRVDMKAEGPVAATLLGELSRFRCPEGW